ncbi:HAUS augmin-like complex subunit 6 isoform X2 [Ascaphus truei]|uniref:HAUS augmin-like complex subunit 6 isoform X2 n=2 Tax=Ascaphus truei TaxID=8439 RepID=UPI003F59A77B
MTQSASPRGWQKEHVWLALQGLGFEPGAEAAAAGKTLSHVTLGVNMFDKPNKDAFYMVFHYLFAKLDSTRCKEVFRYCWPPLDKKRDAEFRKACCEWLRKISDDSRIGFPQVVASTFLSPGGPKFVQLLYHFTKYVLLQHIEKDSERATYISESLRLKPQDPMKALTRNKVARHRYLQMVQREDFVIREYQRKAQMLIKQIRDLRSECATLQNQHKMAENVDRDHTKRDDLIQKIRLMWSTMMQILKTMEREVEVVDSVVKGHVDQYCLDGTNVTLNIPKPLVSKIESEIHRLQMENVYEAGKVNLITIVQLLNESLKMLRQEHCQYDCKGIQLDLPYLAGKTKFETEVLTRLRHMRHKIRREDFVSLNKSIADKEREWEEKWETLLGQSPFSLLKGLNPVLELQPPMAPFSFDPATEEVLRSSVFCQYPASFPDSAKKDVRLKDLDRDYSGSLLRSLLDFTSTGRNSLSLTGMTPAKRRMSLNEKELRSFTPNMKERSFSQTTPNFGVQKRRSDETWKRAEGSMPQYTPTPSKQDPMRMARQQLAQQVADDIVSESPRCSGGREMELDDLIGMLASNPFLTKKQIPRTPENLISDIRTSWRKAIQVDESADVVASPLEAPSMESPAELKSAHSSQIDLSMACLLSASHVSDTNESSEGRTSANTGRSLPHEPTVSCHNTTVLSSYTCLLGQEGFSVPMKESETTETLVPTLLDKNETYVLDIQPSSKLMDNTMLISVLSQENNSTHTPVSWDSSNMVERNKDSARHEVIQCGILSETLPDVMGDISLNSSKSIEDDEGIQKSKLAEGNSLFSDKAKGGWTTTERRMDIHSIRSRYEALKRTFLSSRTDREDEGTPRRFSKQKSESNLSLDACNVFSPLETSLTLDLDYLMTPSTRDRKLSLPQLLVFSPVEEDIHAKMQENIVDLLDYQEAGDQSKTFDFKQPASDLQKCTD